MILSPLKCLVTGASSGIGKSTCETLTQYGATVVGTGRNEVALKDLKLNGGISDYIVADITEKGECQRVVNTAVEMMGGRLTTVINAAGVLQAGAMDSIDLSNYEFNMSCNAQAPFEIMCHAIPYLKVDPEKNRSIITVSSVNGKQSFAGCAAYCMSKAAGDPPNNQTTFFCYQKYR